MQKKVKTARPQNDAPKHKLPSWAGWLIGYACTLAAGAGLVYFWRIAFYLEKLPLLLFALGVMGLFSLLYLALYLICRFVKNTNLRAAVCVFVLGLLFVFASGPLQAPDESDHYLRAYAIAHGRLDYDAQRTYPDDVSALYRGFPAKFNHTIRYGGEEMIPSAFVAYRTALAEGTAVQPVTEPPNFHTLPYLPQALGMLIGRLFGLGALGLMYAGRIGNLLAYALIAYATFKNCNKYRGVFFALELLPLSLFLAASNSYDGLLLAASFYAVSFFCKREIHSRDVVLFGLAILYATYIKVPYIVLAPVLLLIPAARWRTKFNPWLSLGIILALSLLFMQGMNWLGGNVLAHNFAATLARGAGEGADPGPARQLAQIFSHLPRFVAVALLTLYENAGFLFTLGTFGWLDLSIPLVSGLSVLSLCAASALGIQQKDDTKTSGALALFLAALLFGAGVMAGIYVTFTDVGSIRITGLQPRYFLPMFLLLFMLASILLGKAVRPRLAPAGTLERTETLTLCIVSGVAFFSALLLFQNTFIGQWFEKAEGGFKLVNLLGWRIL